MTILSPPVLPRQAGSRIDEDDDDDDPWPWVKGLAIKLLLLHVRYIVTGWMAAEEEEAIEVDLCSR